LISLSKCLQQARTLAIVPMATAYIVTVYSYPEGTAYKHHQYTSGSAVVNTVEQVKLCLDAGSIRFVI
jgi:hypothetical protein